MNRIKPSKKDVYIISLIGINAVVGSIALFSRNDFLLQTFNLIIIISGLWMFVSALGSMKKSISSRFWDKLEYKVVETSFTMRNFSDRAGAQYNPFFKISYTRNGEVYTRTSEENLNLSIGRVFSTPHDAQKYLNNVMNYSYGNTVYVNPKNPHIAYLESGVGRNQVGMFIFSLFLILFPALTLSGLIVWR